ASTTRRFDLTQEVSVERGGVWVEQQRGSLDARKRVLQQSDPFADQCRIDESEAGNVAAGPRQAFYESKTDGIVGQGENDRHRVGELLQSRDHRRAVGEDHVGGQGDQFTGVLLNETDPASRPAIFDANVRAVLPAEAGKSPTKRGNTHLAVDVAFRDRHEHTNCWYAPGALCAPSERPRCRASQKQDEVAAADACRHLSHWIEIILRTTIGTTRRAPPV